MTAYPLNSKSGSGDMNGSSTAGLQAGYEAIRTGAAIVDRTDRRRFVVTGERAAEVLTGLLTNDVLALGPGSGQYAAALTPKGKVIADVRLFARSSDLLLDTSAAAGEGLASVLRKYVNPRLARYKEVTAELGTIGLYGPRSVEVLAQVAGIEHKALGALAPYQHLDLPLRETPILVARVPDAGVVGFDIFGRMDALQALVERLVAAGAAIVPPATLEVARIEAGRPAWGLDMDESTLAQEALLDRLQAISFTKGCYVGQETVARIHFRGHVNRLLRGLRFSGEKPAQRGWTLLDLNGKPVGDVRSTALSPRLGAIALAMVRREVQPGTTVQAVGDNASLPATVVELPFPE
jgi:folate-binding protein YgfZ